MSRSGYCDYIGQWDLIRWRGAVASAIRGKRGQRLLIDLRDALDSMPDKRLIAGELIKSGEVCALGSLAQVRRLDVSAVDPDDRERVADLFDISPALAAEIVDENDEGPSSETPEQRWERMRGWVDSKIGATA